MTLSTLIHRRVEEARRGENPAVIRRMPSGWAVMGDWQFLPGYCLVLPDPVADDLNCLDLQRRRRFLLDMSLLGDALLEVTDAVRINYEILGNREPALHAHVLPRYAWEPEPFRSGPTSRYDRTAGPAFDLDRHGELMSRVGAALDQFLAREG